MVPDGLELLLVCILTRFYLNLLQKDHFWSTRISGSQNSDPMVMFTTCRLLFCNWFVDGTVPEVDGQLLEQGAAAVEFDSDQLIQISDSDSLEEFYTAHNFVPQASYSIDSVCHVCSLEAKTAQQLHQHLCQFHVDSRMYICQMCSASFLLLSDLHAHDHNVHQPTHFSYK